MTPAHELALAEVRTYLAALADQAATTKAASSYEHALLAVDNVHGDITPAVDRACVQVGASALFERATSAVESLAVHGVDELQIELVLAMLSDARGSDGA
jgi:hypothetical protein